MVTVVMWPLASYNLVDGDEAGGDEVGGDEVGGAEVGGDGVGGAGGDPGDGRRLRGPHEPGRHGGPGGLGQVFPDS